MAAGTVHTATGVSNIFSLLCQCLCPGHFRFISFAYFNEFAVKGRHRSRAISRWMEASETLRGSDVKPRPRPRLRKRPLSDDGRSHANQLER
jgi:hypothetical protein